jgi:hypothetical protein
MILTLYFVAEYYLKSTLFGKIFQVLLTGRSYQDKGLRSSPTKGEDDTILGFDDYGLKVRVTFLQKKPKGF